MLTAMSRILLIEDDESFRRMLCRTLKRAGHQVIGAAMDAKQSIASLETVDLVLTDIIMPDYGRTGNDSSPRKRLS
jgi:DNA-binding response OmpR family regulator